MARAAADAGARTTFLTVGLCFLIAMCEGFDLQAAGVAAPRLGPAFSLSPDQLAWFFSSSTFGLMLGAAVGGRLSDFFGRKAVLIASVAVFGAMSVATGMAQDYNGLLIFRFLTGVGLGGALPNLVALTAENSRPDRKNTAVGLLYAGLPTGGAVASLITVFGTTEDWRVVFYVGGFAPLVLVPLLIWILPESRQLQQAKAAGEVSQRSLMYALAGESRAARTLLLWLAFFLALLTMYLLLNWLPLLLIGKGLTRPEASLVQLSFNVFGAMASFATGAMMDRLSLPKVVAGSFIAAAVALGLLAGAPPELMIAVLIGGLVGISMSATQALLYALAPTNYPTSVRGTGVGSAVTVGRLGSAAGPLLGAALLGSGRAPQEVLVVLIPIILVAGAAAFVLTIFMGRAKPADAPPA